MKAKASAMMKALVTMKAQKQVRQAKMPGNLVRMKLESKALQIKTILLLFPVPFMIA
ncbi:MAG: hypothetical protein QM289_01820 [Bacillota bacterium]|jgi:hypothetical protein|nr:hypothetical protein [Bacillota bacterium]